MAANKVYGLDPDPVGATFVELEAQDEELCFSRWGLIRPPGCEANHKLLLSLEDFTPYLRHAVVGIEVVERMYKPGKQQAALQKTRDMGVTLLEQALAQTPWAFSFPGIARLPHEEIFLEGSWVHRLTGLRYPRQSDVILELRQSVRGVERKLHNPHFRDALGVAVLAYRLALRKGFLAT